jgi:hypothetical protein
VIRSSKFLKLAFVIKGIKSTLALGLLHTASTTCRFWTRALGRPRSSSWRCAPKAATLGNRKAEDDSGSTSLHLSKSAGERAEEQQVQRLRGWSTRPAKQLEGKSRQLEGS